MSRSHTRSARRDRRRQSAKRIAAIRKQYRAGRLTDAQYVEQLGVPAPRS